MAEIPIPLDPWGSPRELLLHMLKRADKEKWECAVVIGIDGDGHFRCSFSEMSGSTLCWMARGFDKLVDNRAGFTEGYVGPDDAE